MSPAVVGHGQSSSVVRQRDAVGFTNAGVHRSHLAGLRIDPSHLRRACVGEQDEAVLRHGQVVGLHAFGNDFHFAGCRVDGNHPIL